MHADRGKLQKTLEDSAEYMSRLEERVFTANKTKLDLLKQVHDLESERETLKGYIVDLKARVAVYVPVKEDPVDVQVADFINNYPNRSRLKVMFARQAAGVYEFGSKRVYLRLENGKLIIKVGGGYLTMDEFLD